MIVKRGESSGNVQNAIPAPNIVARLLKTKQYKELDELLQQAQSSIQQRNYHLPLDEVLVAARQICMVCSILQDEAHRHRWAAGEAEHQEDELGHILKTIVDTIGGNTHYLDLSAQHSLNGRERNIWQRLQGLLNPELRFLPSNGKVSVITPVQAQHTAVDPVDSDQESVSPDLKQTEADLIIYGLSAFQVYLNGQAIENWLSRKSKSIFKYIILHRARPVAKEVLMNCFWPDLDPDAARNNLNVAIYGLRQTLHKVDATVSYILFEHDCYLLNPDLTIWVDFETFMEHYKKGQLLEKSGDWVQAISEYRVAELLYQGQLFEDDRYEDWPVSQRQMLEDAYLHILNCLSLHYLETQDFSTCVALCMKMLVVDPCQEEAHRRLMYCYSRQGQRYLALRQYNTCVEVYKKELEMLPSPETVELYEKIRANRKL